MTGTPLYHDHRSFHPKDMDLWKALQVPLPDVEYQHAQKVMLGTISFIVFSFLSVYSSFYLHYKLQDAYE